MHAMTVLGPVDAEDLGVVLPHEHILIDLRHHAFAVEAILDDPDLAVDELQRFRAAGGGTVVDVTNRYMGRSVETQLRVARETGLHVIASTGYYTELYYPPHVYQWTTNKLADEMIAELTIGIGDTGVRAGIIGEIGTMRDAISPAGERIFRAVARAHLQTGAPISTHVLQDELAHDQMDLLEDEGVDLGHVIIGHQGDHRNIDYLASIAERGAFVQIDHVGMEFYQRDEARAYTIAQLVELGYAEQLLLSHDVCFKRLLHWWGGKGYDHMLTGFVPLLREAGVSDVDINRMLVDNPKRALARFT
jgi:predicted metal-dependent phosphotriesterase family hydrolase